MQFSKKKKKHICILPNPNLLRKQKNQNHFGMYLINKQTMQSK